MKRRDILKNAAVAAPGVMSVGMGEEADAHSLREAEGHGRWGAKRRRRPMNIILFITDQERAIQHFPNGWAEANLPGLQRLQRNGLTFDRAFCASCMCSPSRASMLTGLFPAQHQVKDTLTFGTDYSNQEQQLPRNLPNLATIMHEAGYDVVYKGKWHLSKPLSNPQTEQEAILAWRPRDLAIYGFDRWTPPDAGENQDLNQFGGGTANHDERYMTGETNRRRDQEGALDYLQDVARHDRPFCLIVSLVNPHDVLSYPRTWQIGGYDSDAWLQGDIGLPETWNEDLSTKPAAQQQFVQALATGLGPLTTEEQRLAYLNFYGNLMKHTDAYLQQMLGVLDERGFTENTLVIRTSDHGEMGLTHGGMRQKMFNFYEESLRVPLVYSNPVMFPRERHTDAMVSHVDLLPTLASLVGAKGRSFWQGVDYSRLLKDPNAKAPQSHVLFTYDDLRCGQNTEQLVDPPNRIVAIREERYKLARYYDGDGNVPDQWEMYDLLNDPLEQDNLARPGYVPTPQQAAERSRLTLKLKAEAKRRLQPLRFERHPTRHAPARHDA
jgi:arylsulfatase A-like enzyme